MVILYHGILIILQIFLKKYLLSFFLPFQKRTILTVKSSDEHRYLHIDLLCPKLCTGFPQMVSETLYWQFFASNQLLITDGSPEKLSLNTGRKEMKQQDFMYSGLGECLKKEWKIYLAALIFIIIADSIGQIKIPLGPGTLILFPIFYSIFLGILSGPQILKIFKKPEVKAASKLVIVCICPFIAKLGINAGASIETVISAGPALLLQEFGNLGTIFLSLPIALLLGLKREAVGACHSINRETNLALMQDVFGPDSAEARGSLSIYIIGGMVGTIFFGFMATVIASTGIFHPYSLGMASGVGAGIMMATATATLSEMFPAMADQISALASASETISGIDGIYMALFVGIPLCNWLYAKLEPKLGPIHDKLTGKGRKGEK